MDSYRQYLSFRDWLISLSIMSSRFIHYVRISFLLTFPCISIHPSMDTGLLLFFLVVVNNAAMDMGVTPLIGEKGKILLREEFQVIHVKKKQNHHWNTIVMVAAGNI